MTVRGFARILWRQKWVVLATLALIVMGAVAYQTTLEKTYLSTVEVSVNPDLVGGNATTGASGMSVRPFIANDPAVVRATAEASGVAPGAIAGRLSATLTESGDLVVAAVGSSPENAQALADALATVAATNLRLQVDEYIASLRESVDTAAVQLNNLPPDTDGTASVLVVAQRGIYQDQYTAAFSSLTQALAVNESVTISGPAPPGTLSSVPLGVALEVAILVGIIAGVGMALLRYWLDGRVADAADAAAATDLPVVGAIPVDPVMARTGRPMLVTTSGSTAAVVEDIRRMRTAMASILDLDEGSVVVVTGAVEGDGASFVAANLAAASARAGKSTVVASGDLRRSNIGEYFGIVSGDDASVDQARAERTRARQSNATPDLRPTDHGFADSTGDGGAKSVNGSTAGSNRALRMRGRLAVGGGSVDPDMPALAVTKVAPDLPPPRMSLGASRATSLRLVATGIDGLSLLPSLAGVGATIDSLAGERVRSVLTTLQARADLIVLDAPPLLEFGDALTLAEYADALVVVVRSRRTRTRDLVRAAAMARGSKGHTVRVGIVVNRIRRSRWSRRGAALLPRSRKGNRDDSDQD